MRTSCPVAVKGASLRKAAFTLSRKRAKGASLRRTAFTLSRLREREGRMARERVEQGIRTACGAPAERWSNGVDHAPCKGRFQSVSMDITLSSIAAA